MTSFKPEYSEFFLQIMALKLLLGIASDIAESGYHSIIADASADATSNARH